MATKKIKIIGVDDLKKTIEKYGKLEENSETLFSVFLTEEGKMNLQNTTQINLILRLIGENMRSISDAGEIVWSNKKFAKPKTAKQFQSDLKKLITMGLLVGGNTLIVEVIRRAKENKEKKKAEVRAEKALQRKRAIQTIEKTKRIKERGRKLDEDEEREEALAKAVLENAEIKDEVEQQKEMVEQKEEEFEMLAQEVLEMQIVRNGAENAEEAVAERDVEQDEVDVENVGIAVAVNEAPLEQAPIDQQLQEEQLELNINVGAEGIVNIELVEQNALVEQNVGVEPIEPVVVDDIVQIVVNEEEKEAEIKGVEVDVDADRLQLIEHLNLMDTLLIELLKIINNTNTGNINDTARDLAQLDNQTGAFSMSIRGKDLEIQKLLKSVQGKYNGERKKVIDRVKAEMSTEMFIEEKKELDVKLSKVEIALTKIRDRQYHDGLMSSGSGRENSESTAESKLIVEAFDQIVDDIKINNNVSDNVIGGLQNLVNIISQDALDIITDVLTNTISEGDVFNLTNIPTRTATGLFVRFLSRVLYSGTGFNDRDGDSMVEGFLNHRGRLEGQNQGVVDRLRSALQLIIPRPPPIIQRPNPFPSISAGGGLRQRRPVNTPQIQGVGSTIPRSSSREVDDFLTTFNRDLNNDLASLDEQKEGTFKNLFDRMERGTTDFVRSTGASVDTRDMNDEEFEKQMEKMEDLELNLGSIAKGIATASIASSQVESLKNFVSSKMTDFTPSIETIGAIRNSLRYNPNEIPNILRGVGRGILPIFRRQPGENIRGGRVVHIIMGALMGVIYQAIVSNTQETQETKEQERENDTTEAKRGTTTEFEKGEEKEVPVEDIDKPTGIGLLRADFEMVGIDFFNKQFSTTPLDMQNSEWAEYNYVPNTDRQNNIEIDNSFGESVRFQEPMFMPKYQQKLKPPSQLAVNLGRDRMTPAIQLSQGFAPKFSGAVNVYDNLSYTFNNDAFSRSWEDNKLYHPDSSIF